MRFFLLFFLRAKKRTGLSFCKLKKLQNMDLILRKLKKAQKTWTRFFVSLLKKWLIFLCNIKKPKNVSLFMFFFFLRNKSSQIMDSILCKLKEQKKTLIQFFASSKNINLIFVKLKEFKNTVTDLLFFFLRAQRTKKHGLF